MAIIQSQVWGPTRTEVSENATNRLSGSLQNLGALRENQRQFNVTEGLKSFGNTPIAFLAATEAGQQALAPVIGQLYGYRGKDLQNYLTYLQTMPRDVTVDQMLAQYGQSHGYINADRQGMSEQDALQAHLAGMNRPAPTPAPASQPSQASAPAPAPTDAGLNEYMLKAVREMATRRAAEKLRAQAPGEMEFVGNEFQNTDSWSRPIAAIQNIPNPKIPTSEAIGEEERAILAQIMQPTPEGKALWNELSQLSTRALQAIPEATALGKKPVSTTGYEGETGVTPVGESHDAYLARAGVPTIKSIGPEDPSNVYGSRNVYTWSDGTKSYDEKRTQMVPGFERPKAGAGAGVGATPTQAPSTFREFLVEYQSKNDVGPTWSPVGAKGSLSDEQLKLRVGEDLVKAYDAWKAGNPPSWVTGQSAGTSQASAQATQTLTGNQGQMTADDQLLARYFDATYGEGPALSGTELARAKYLSNQVVQKYDKAARTTWRAAPGLSETNNRFATETAGVLNRTYTGGDVKDHPYLSGMYTDWSGLNAKKLDAEARLLSAQADMTEQEAKYYLESLKVEAMGHVIDEAQLQLEGYKDIIGSLENMLSGPLKPAFDEVYAIQDPDERTKAMDKLMNSDPLTSSLWQNYLNGISIITRSPLTVTLKEYATGGFLGLFKEKGTSTSVEADPFGMKGAAQSGYGLNVTDEQAADAYLNGQ